MSGWFSPAKGRGVFDIVQPGGVSEALEGRKEAYIKEALCNV